MSIPANMSLLEESLSPEHATTRLGGNHCKTISQPNFTLVCLHVA